MIRHASPISGVACSPQGYVATAGYDNQIILWDRRRPVARAWHDHLANQCDFSRDGALLVTSSSDYTARVWKVPELRLVSVLAGHDDDVEMAVFSPDATMVATASRDSRVRVFEISGRLIMRFEGHGADVISVAWSPDGDQLISSSDDGTVRRWCLRNGRELGLVDMRSVETDTVVIGVDGVIFAGNDRGEIHVVVEGRHHVVNAHDAGIKRLALSHDGTRLASASYDRSLRLWDIHAHHRLSPRHTTEAPPEAWLRSVTFDRENMIVTGTFGTTYAVFKPEASLWDTSEVKPTGGVNAVCWSEDAVWTVGDAGEVRRDGAIVQELGSLCNFLIPWRNRLLTGGHLGQVFDAMTGDVLHRHRSPLNCATILPDGDVLVGTYTGEGVRLGIDPSTGAVQWKQTVLLQDQAIKGISANASAVFSVSASGAASFHDVRDLRAMKRLPRAHRKIANGACVLPDGGFASVSRDLCLRLWRQDLVDVIQSPHDHSIKCIALSSNRRWLGTGSYHGTVAFYDLELNRWASVTRPSFSGISSLSACNKDDCLLASSYDGAVYQVTPDVSSVDAGSASILRFATGETRTRRHVAEEGHEAGRCTRTGGTRDH